MTKNIGTALQNLDAVDVFRLAFEQSGKTAQEVADEMRVSLSYVKRVYSTEKFYPSFENLPAFCAAVGNTTVLSWLFAQATMHGVDNAARTISCHDLLVRMNTLYIEIGEAADETRKTILDGEIEQAECRRMINELHDVANCVMKLIRDLRAMMNRQDAMHG